MNNLWKSHFEFWCKSGKSVNSWTLWTSYKVKNSRKNENRFTAVTRIKQLDFGLQNWWTFEERAVLASRVFKVWKYLLNQVVLAVKRISLLYVVWYWLKRFASSIRFALFTVRFCWSASRGRKTKRSGDAFKKRLLNNIFFELLEKRWHNIQFQLRTFCNASRPLSSNRSKRIDKTLSIGSAIKSADYSHPLSLITDLSFYSSSILNYNVKIRKPDEIPGKNIKFEK